MMITAMMKKNENNLGSMTNDNTRKGVRAKKPEKKWIVIIVNF